MRFFSPVPEPFFSCRSRKKNMRNDVKCTHLSEDANSRYLELVTGLYNPTNITRGFTYLR
jgi:hypothetical protein